MDAAKADLRQRVTKGPGSRAAGVAMAFKLIEPAQQRWRAVNAPHLVALVRAGARFEKGLLVERPDESGGDQLVGLCQVCV
jgi:putative transposase